MIDPITALEGLQSAIGLVRKAAKVANDLGGLAPMLGKLFDAKSQATKAMVEAKRSGNKSNFSLAMQIENALMQTAKLEAELQLMYMQTGNIDVWNKIKARAAEMDRDDAIEARKAKDEEKKRKEAEAEQMQWAVAIVIIVMFIGAVGWGISEVSDICARSRCGR
jgi:antitoxin component of MazEF toxin-antitoxin module